MKKNNHPHLLDLNSTIIEVRRKISEDPDPFLVEVLKKLEVVRSHQQDILENNARQN